MDAFKTHGAPSWSELTTTDPSAAADFYGKLLGWKFESMDMPGGVYRVVKVGDSAVAGIMGQPLGAPPMPSAWGTYVTVDNVDEIPGRVSLVFALRGLDGNYGTGEEADLLLPELLGLPPLEPVVEPDDENAEGDEEADSGDGTDG